MKLFRSKPKPEVPLIDQMIDLHLSLEQLFWRLPPGELVEAVVELQQLLLDAYEAELAVADPKLWRRGHTRWPN